MSFKLILFVFFFYLLIFIASTKMNAFLNLMKRSHTFTRETGFIAADIINAEH
jgi:hypothetical protein